MSQSLRSELRVLAVFLAGACIGVPVMYLAFPHHALFGAPEWYIAGFTIFMVLAAYVWWRQGLSPDKSSFTPPPVWRRPSADPCAGTPISKRINHVKDAETGVEQRH